MRLQTRLILLIGTLLLVTIIVLTLSFERMLAAVQQQNTGAAALKIAKAVASLEVIRSGFEADDPSSVIQPVAEQLRTETGAEFIVVGNRDGIRYAHPIEERIGMKMVGGDNGPVLQGHAIISEAVGSMGSSVRGKAPVFDRTGQVVGVVSVGFMIEKLQREAAAYRTGILLTAAFTLLSGCAGAIWIARRVKRSIFGLEPHEIGMLYQEKKAILETVHEGIIAVNAAGGVTLVNQTAMKLLGRQEGEGIIGTPILELLPESRLMEVLRTGRAEFDQEMLINGSTVVVNRLPIRDHGQQVMGAVSSFRNKSELLRVTEELTQVKRYAEALRTQTHEYSNKLYTIYGLIQLESYQEAMDLITHETDVHQNLIHFLMREIPDPMIGGILIGKFNRANEMKVELTVSERSSFKKIPGDMNRNHLVTIIGNLIDNALEAVIDADEGRRQVNVLLSDRGGSLLIEVADFGAGVPKEAAAQIFETGYSTKAASGRGFGLAIVRQAAEELGGSIKFQSTPERGTVFQVNIPISDRKGEGP